MTATASLTPPSRQLDAHGGHWETHGRNVTLLLGKSRHGAAPAAISVHSQRSPQHYAGAPHVTLGCSAEPFAVTLRLSPQDALALSVQILEAAQAARDIERQLAGEGVTA
jgi:hypothetical protein